MEPRLGMISPDGKFYPCGYGCHEALCKKICNELGYRTYMDQFYISNKDSNEEDPEDLRDKGVKLYSSYEDTLYHKGWAAITFQLNGMPLFMIHGKYTPAQWEIVDKLIDEFSCMTSEQLSDTIRDNRENLDDSWSCGFAWRDDLDLQDIRKWLNYERREYQRNPEDYVLNTPALWNNEND